MFFLPVKDAKKTLSFDGDTLIVPIVSTGNVGQLAIDIFLSTGRTKSPPVVEKVGYLNTDTVAPVAGYEVFGPGQPPQLCVNLELHRFADKGVTMLQQRGPVFPGEEEAFAKELVRWARESGFKSILALAGADAAEGLDPTPLGRGAIKRFHAWKPPGTLSQQPPPPCALEEALQDAGVGAFDSFSAMADGGGYGGLAIVPPMGGGPLEGTGALGGGYGVGEEGSFEAAGHAEEIHHDPITMPSPNGFNTSQALSKFPRLPTGTGVAGNLCRESALTREGPDASPPLVLLLHFCGEGDNTPQAVDMADVVNLALDVLPGLRGSSSSSSGDFSWSSPLSWASLYGPPPGNDVNTYQ
ncbi:unnamed protein product [Ascophyllum nodosum]